MSTLQTRSHDTIVGSIAAGMQGRINAFLNFAVGTLLRALAEAYGGVCLWLQSQNLANAKLTRLATSYGPDADSYVADYGIITRLGAQPATGIVTFARYTAGTSAPFIPVGTLVQTQDGSQKFAVYGDPTNGNFSVALQGYTMPSAIGSIDVPVQAVVAGSAGNIAAGAISLPYSSVAGVDTVTNAAALANGSDGEQDDPFKARFRLAILGLSRGNIYGTEAALAGTNVNIQYNVVENQNVDGSYRPGFYLIYADDGSGAPSASFLTAVTTAAQSVRPLGNQLAVMGPTIATANWAMQITTLPGYVHNVVVAQVTAAVDTAIAQLGLGNGLPYFMLAAWALGVQGVSNVAAVTLNGGTVDIPGSPGVTIKPGNATVS